MSKFLFVGLGNIGTEYANTRHNIGFDVMNAFVLKHGGSFKADRLAYVAEIKFKGKQVVCICPTTYMNLSGRAFKYWLHVFPFLRTLGGDESTCAHHMKDARFTIPAPRRSM
jgi:peptidyl-tRNA hydrolase